MKKILLVFSCALLTSCYTQKMVVGDGPESGIVEKSKSHYLLYGLVPLKEANTKEMSKGADNYRVKIEHSFVDGLIGVLTSGIYKPVSVEVTR